MLNTSVILYINRKVYGIIIMYRDSVQDHRQYYKTAEHTANSATRLNMCLPVPLIPPPQHYLLPTCYVVLGGNDEKIESIRSLLSQLLHMW